MNKDELFSLKVEVSGQENLMSSSDDVVSSSRMGINGGHAPQKRTKEKDVPTSCAIRLTATSTKPKEGKGDASLIPMRERPDRTQHSRIIRVFAPQFHEKRAPFLL